MKISWVGRSTSKFGICLKFVEEFEIGSKYWSLATNLKLCMMSKLVFERYVYLPKNVTQRPRLHCCNAEIACSKKTYSAELSFPFSEAQSKTCCNCNKSKVTLTHYIFIKVSLLLKCFDWHIQLEFLNFPYVWIIKVFKEWWMYCYWKS